MIEHVLSDLESCLPPADYRRAVLKWALVKTLGFAHEDARAYTDGARLADLPDARALVRERYYKILRRRLEGTPC